LFLGLNLIAEGRFGEVDEFAEVGVPLVDGDEPDTEAGPDDSDIGFSHGKGKLGRAFRLNWVLFIKNGH
jgi:hypothetical protein